MERGRVACDNLYMQEFYQILFLLPSQDFHQGHDLCYTLNMADVYFIKKAHPAFQPIRLTRV